MKSIFYY